jgi:glutamate 5-kinase
VVIKIGTSTIMRYDSEGEAGELALSTLGKLVDSIVALRRLNHNVVLVTSGAVGVGCRELGLRKRPDSLRTKQAMAAIGQCKLMRVYDDLFRFSGQTIAQILLTRENLSQKHQYFNARNTMRELLRLGVVPIVNENDTVATEELRFGDNDRLSSLVAGMVEAKWLFLLTDVDKLYTADPRCNPSAEPIDLVHDMEQLHIRLSANEDAQSSGREHLSESDSQSIARAKRHELNANVPRGGTQWGSGGMATKIVAAQLATAAGVNVCIMHGRRPEGILERVLDKKGSSRIGTVFLASREPIRGGRKRWIAHGLAPKGKLYVDEGACRAVARHNSLFAVGIREIEGDFEADTAVSVVRQNDGLEVGRGLTNYSADELRRVIGLHSKEMRRVLGYPGPDEVIHRDNLVDLLGTISSSDADETD